jgi:hypothetical protein
MATIIELPTADGKTVKQEGRPGRLPKAVASLQRERDRRGYDAALAEAVQRELEKQPGRAEIIKALKAARLSFRIGAQFLAEMEDLLGVEPDEEREAH